MNHIYISDPNLCYMDGNSLGRLPHATTKRLDQVIRNGWGEDLIRGWNMDWIDLPQRLGNQIATLIGASESEVVIADSTTINLFKLATAALRSVPGRSKIILERTNFPSDLYALESAVSAANSSARIELAGEATDIEFPAEPVMKKVDQDTAIVVLSHVAFRSGALANMRELTERIQRKGALVLWDLSHSVGAVPIDLNSCNADLAVGCTYKYLCGGPGAPAFMYVRSDLQGKLQNPIQGWFGHSDPFNFELNYQSHSGIDKFLTGTPPVLSMCAIEEGVKLVSEAGVPNLRTKSIELSQLFLEHYASRLTRLGYSLRSPTQAEDRGSHLAFGHPEARRITANLIDRHKVIPEFQKCDLITTNVK